MRYQRVLAPRLQRLVKHFPVLVLTGARQTGKTTLLRESFPSYRYVSLDLPSTAALAEREPAQFLARYPAPLLVDEVQYAPNLFRHLKVAVDQQTAARGLYVLTGSQKFTLMREVTESLAGRCAWVELETLCVAEIIARDGREKLYAGVAQLLTRGTFPALWRDPEIDATDFYSAYLATYLERDVRQLLNIVSLRDFERFLRLCATYTGQLINKAAFGRTLGVAGKTIDQWLSVLSASNQVTLLEPYFANVGKRLSKMPKLYFNDTGLASFLLGLRQDDLATSPFRGALWETFVYSELRKLQHATAPQTQLYFYRDQQQREVDFVRLGGAGATLLECKFSELPQAKDARRMAEVAQLFAAAKPQPIATTQSYVVGCPHDSYPLTANCTACHGFALQEVLQPISHAQPPLP